MTGQFVKSHVGKDGKILLRQKKLSVGESQLNIQSDI